MADVFSNELPELLVDHYEHLLKSAISPEVMRERGYRTILGKAELQQLGFRKFQCRIPGILITLWAPDGSPAGYQYRPDKPRLDAKGRPIKYENAMGEGLRLDVPNTRGRGLKRQIYSACISTKKRRPSRGGVD